MLDSILHTIKEELSDLSDAAGVTRVCVRLLVAGILGGLLGYEREASGKSAGLRTHILVSLGAALFVLVPQQAGATQGDLTRVLQGLVAGIGFLGAGAIIHNSRGKEDKSGSPGDNEVKGLTTAAGIWMTAAIGMSAGMGREVTAVLSTVLALIVLAVLPKLIGKVGG
ncbi:MAG: MgtC/SapB family protein [Phycisphaerales bacterium]|nr:MgtC/SapB family protein [Phycisphaerales bacterium]